jgi:hypothetical protein
MHRTDNRYRDRCHTLSIHKYRQRHCLFSRRCTPCICCRTDCRNRIRPCNTRSGIGCPPCMLAHLWWVRRLSVSFRREVDQAYAPRLPRRHPGPKRPLFSHRRLPSPFPPNPNYIPKPPQSLTKKRRFGDPAQIATIGFLPSISFSLRLSVCNRCGHPVVSISKVPYART